MASTSSFVRDDQIFHNGNGNGNGNEKDEKVEMEMEMEMEQAESHLFREKDIVIELMNAFGPSTDKNEISRSTNLSASESALKSIRTIIDKYLECPTLLDPSLEEMVEKLVHQVKWELSSSSANHVKDLNNTMSSIRFPLTALYALTKVRGYKCVNRFLSHTVEDVDLIWNALRSWKQSALCNANCWEPLYMLWHWVGVLSLVPFDSQVMSGESNLVQHIVDEAKSDLAQYTGPVQEAATTCLASWLCRPDVNLLDFTSWTVQVVQDYAQTAPQKTSLAHDSLNLILGVLQVTTKVLKHASTSRQLLIDRLVEPLWEPLIQLANDPECSSNLLLRRYLVKWWTRTSCTYFPPGARVFAPWRYQRGKRVLLMDQLVKQSEEEEPTEQMSTTRKEKTVGTSEEEFFHVPDNVEEAMGRIIESLAHSSTIVRWSAAKGIGRVTERLPKLCALDVLDAVLEYFENKEKDNCWHGACLALAELARKGLLLPDSLPEVVVNIIRAIQYDVRRGHSSVGNNVRDAACYAFWAFARSYSPQVLKFHLDKLAEAVVLTSLFDREVNCRRAASAAFQEAVGRQGLASFPNGIFVITSADFHSVGNRNESYTTIARKIAKLEEYRQPIIKHLYEEKLFHWDLTIRKLASLSLAFVAPLDVRYISHNAIPFLLEKCLDSNNLHVRHGAVLGVAELVGALGAEVLEKSLSRETFEGLLDLVNQIEQRRLYRGRGGETMRAAVCRLVECISIAKIPLEVKNQVRMLDSVDASIPHPNEEISRCACTALKQLLTVYFPVSEKGPTDRLHTRVFMKFLKEVQTSKNPAATRGYALALGHLPGKLLAPTSEAIDSVVNALSSVTDPRAKVEGEGDAETRRNAVWSLTRVVETIILTVEETNRKFPIHDISPVQCSRALRALFHSFEDYNVDRRGDVGSWVRIATMEGLTSLVQLCDIVPAKAKIAFHCFSGTELVGLLIKQLSEKLDGVRVRAASCLQKVLLRENSDFPSVVGRKYLISSLEIKDCTIDYNWAEPRSVFRRTMTAAMVTENDSYPYYDYAIAGICVSVGGKVESAQATSALISHAKEAQLIEENRQRLGTCLLKLFKTYTCVGRVTMPLLRSIDKLLARGCFEELLAQDDSFAISLRMNLELEREGCKDIHRLLALVDVAGALINALPKGSEEKHKIMEFMCQMLSHSYPKVRSHTAEILYLAIEENPDTLPCGTTVTSTTLVLETPWGTDLTKEEVIQYTNDLSKALGFGSKIKD